MFNNGTGPDAFRSVRIHPRLVSGWKDNGVLPIEKAMSESRRDPRVNHYFDCRWFGKWGATDARLDDLSVSGCHVVNRFSTPSMGETVEIDVVRTAADPLLLSGEVVHVERGVGFSVRFGEVNADIRAQIAALMESAESSNRRVAQY